MYDWTVDEFLTRLASRTPAPGGGAAAGTQAAMGAALLAMVARYSDGEVAGRVVTAADELRETGLRLAAADAAAFEAVGTAYKLPKTTDDERQARTAAISSALAGAVEPPLAVIAAARQLIDLAEQLLPVSNKNVITDIAAAAESIRAAAAISRVNVEINRGPAADIDDLLVRAEDLTTAVRREIAP
ncbi:cyclodeaminase/cyclohydrolase family protein [Fodinicola feengrottensis]|uniref:Cyclodeaminase/cyclohydrolase family protein n=1 Tax=Fodinicola feengrottensis TaxID=435914 RepID=A0ABN2HXF9_9ACTN